MEIINKVKWKEDYVLFSDLTVEEQEEFGQLLHSKAFEAIGYVCEEKKVVRQ